MFINYITIALPHVAYIFVLGMLFYFYLRQIYIKAILKVTSIVHPTPDYIRVRRKVRILGAFQLALLLAWLWLLLPDWIAKVIRTNMSYIWLTSLATSVGFMVVLIAGGEAAKWLTHDEDFNEQLTKNNKK
jgi:hypothetical protein